jgi:hypothetical protein
MSSTREYFLYTDYSPSYLLDDLYENMLGSYYKSPVGVSRCDVNESLRKEIEKLINIPIADCGFLKTTPQQVYPIHTDVFRICAINMPMFEPNSSFESFVFDGGKLIPIEYKKNYFTILNVMKPHGVINKSQETERVVLSVGIKVADYNACLQKFTDGELFNAVL